MNNNLSEVFESNSNIENMMKHTRRDCTAVAVSVVVGDQILFQKTSGSIGSHSDFPASNENTAFLLASITKTFLAVICLQCIERNQIDLDADINTYTWNESNARKRYPAVQVMNPHFPDASITIRHLLTHRSGLTDDERALEEGSKWRTENDDSPISLYEYVSRRLVPGNTDYDSFIWNRRDPPGAARYSYSNAGFALLGFVIEQATGESLNDLAHRDIFKPLNMKHTDYFLSFFRKPENADCQVALPHWSPVEPMNHYCVAEWPACQIRSTLGDLTRYLLAFTGPTCPLLRDQSLLQVLMPENMTNGLAWWGKDSQYGDKSGAFWAHGGFMEGVRTHIYLFPEQRNPGEDASSLLPLSRQRKGIIILTNGSGDYEYVFQAARKGLRSLPSE